MARMNSRVEMKWFVITKHHGPFGPYTWRMACAAARNCYENGAGKPRLSTVPEFADA